MYGVILILFHIDCTRILYIDTEGTEAFQTWDRTVPGSIRPPLTAFTYRPLNKINNTACNVLTGRIICFN